MISFFFFGNCVDALKIPVRKKNKVVGSEFVLYYSFFLDVSFQHCPPVLHYLSALVLLLQVGKTVVLLIHHLCSYIPLFIVPDSREIWDVFSEHWIQCRSGLLL